MDINVNYLTLSPGRERRLAYSYYISTTHPLTSVRSRSRTFRIRRNRIDNLDYFGSIRRFDLNLNINSEFSYRENDRENDDRDLELSDRENDRENDRDLELNDRENDTEINDVSIPESLPDLVDDTESLPESHRLNSPTGRYHENFPGGYEHNSAVNFNNLIDIEKGVISKNLVEKSKATFWELRINDNLSAEFCSICRENFEFIDIIRQIVCKHIFHINCIDTWFTKNKTCPECRYEI